MSNEDTLVATRERRSNAGSRLKRLIEFEEQNSDTRSPTNQNFDEDDENVNLLFQEDDDDEEFVESEEEEEEEAEGEGEEEGEEDGEEGKGDGEEEEEEGADEKQRLPLREESTDIENIQSELKELEEDNISDDNESQGFDTDEMLSSSDISLSDSESDEGEKELEDVERIQKRKNKRKQAIIPAIKRRATQDEPKTKKPKIKKVESEALIAASRSSSRSTAIEKKQALLKKLKEKEAKKAKTGHIVRAKHVELTQEEKLAEAKETEKANILSLNAFMEQEVVKKEKQRQMLLLKRVNLKNVIRLISQESFISPNDEIKEARRLYDIMKARKRLGRKRKNPLPEETRPPGSIDLELPLVKKEMEAKRISYERELEALQQADAAAESYEKNDLLLDKKSEVDTNTSDTTTPYEKINSEPQALSGENDRPLSDNASAMSVSTEEHLNEDRDMDTEGMDNKESIIQENENTEHTKEETSREPVIEAISNEIEDKNVEDVNNTANDDLVESTKEDSTGHEQEEVATEKHRLEDISSISPASEEHGAKDSPQHEDHDENDRSTTKEDEAIASVDQKEPDSKDDNANGATVEDEDTLAKLEDSSNIDDPERKAMRKVKFADELLDTSEQSESSRTTPGIEETGQVYEGPSQRVARNTIYFINFQPQDGKDPDLSTDKVKEMLLGEQSLWPASRRFKDLKAYIRIGNKENPYATNKQEKDELFEPVAELGEDDAIFEPLKKLPRFGVYDEEYEEEEKNVEEENAPIVIRTEAPTGLYLPNGNKKICLISGTEVKYFDPSTGIPYSNVETYRFLKTIEQGNIPWLCIPEEANDNGAVELYLGSRDGSVKPAAGVPEGFDALT